MRHRRLLPAATKLGQGNKFTGVCLSTPGGVPDPNFRGGADPNFRGGGGGGVCCKFGGGVPDSNFGGGGGCLLQIFGGGGSAPIFGGGSEIFFSFFFNLFTPQKQFFWDAHTPSPPPPTPPRRSMRGRYASYWNAFLFLITRSIDHA